MKPFSSRTFLLAALAVATLTSACGVGTVTGEIDGKTVPAFSDAAFGGLEEIGPNDAFIVAGFAMPGDSCEDGSRFLNLVADTIEAEADGDIDDFEDSLRDRADFINEAIPIGEWQFSIQFVGLDIDDVREETFDLEKQEDDDVSIVLLLCLQTEKAEVDSVDGVATINDGADCFSAGEGDLTFSLNDDDSVLRVQGEAIEMQFDDGDNAGDVDIDIRMTGCAGIADGIEALFE